MADFLCFTIERTFQESDKTYYFSSNGNDEMWVTDRKWARRFASIERAHQVVDQILGEPQSSKAQSFTVSSMVWTQEED